MHGAQSGWKCRLIADSEADIMELTFVFCVAKRRVNVIRVMAYKGLKTILMKIIKRYQQAIHTHIPVKRHDQPNRPHQ